MGLVFVVGLAGVGCGPEAAPGRRPNVVLIVVDTLRADHLGCYGYSRPTTPAIDALAAGALRFEHAYAQAPWTTPSVAAILTSRFPAELGIHEAPDRLDDRFATLAETLRAAGYRTGAVISHFFIGKEWNFQQGFESFDDSNVQGHDAVTSAGVSDRAIDFVRAHAAEPFFLLVHYFDPHYDYVQHAGFRFGTPRGYRGPVHSGLAYADLVRLLPSLESADRQRLLDLYDSEVAFTDRHIGRFLDALRGAGLFESSLVVLTADHGEEFLDHGGVGHGGTLYNELIRVPLIVKTPRGTATGVATAAPAALVDVFPTVIGAVGVPPPAALRGRDRLVAAAAAGKRRVWSESDWGRLRAGMDASFKLILNVDNLQEGFYDLGGDPGESRNLIRMRYRPRLGKGYAALRTEFDAWQAEMARASFAAPTVALDDEAAQRLRALGYLH
jgi:arylsulfatase A-like enzyme